MKKRILRNDKLAIKALLQKEVKTDDKGRVLLSKDDEWRTETEWDDLYNQINREKKYSLEELQEKLKENLDKAVQFAEKNTIRNSEGKVVISEDDIWREDDGEDIERPCTPAESLRQSLMEMKEIREGRMPKKSYREMMEDFDNEDEE